MKYAVVIDAGSSGSRSFIYTWPDPVSYLEGLSADSVLKETLLPIETVPLWTTKRQPGISSFAGKPQEIWNDHLKPLVARAQEIIPQKFHRETPIYFLATAGMRLLPESNQTEILKTVCGFLQHKTSFLVPECESHVTVIDGETEALYGWLGLNYLVHWSLKEQWNRFDNTYGFLDMGGASAQLAFAVDPASDDAKLHKSDLQKLRIRTVGGENVEWGIFVATWLGFGANQARMRYLKQLVEELSEESALSYIQENVPIPCIDPCMPIGAVNTEIVEAQNYIFQGSGDFAGCQKRAYKLLNNEKPCDEEPCLFDGKHVPGFDLQDRKFVGISEYWYVLQNMLGNNGRFDSESLLPEIESLCNGDWEDIQRHIHDRDIYKSDDLHFSENDIKKTCFKSAWVITMLKKGFNFDLSPSAPKLGVDFQEKFQSAMEIEGSEISWTLGRTVLYASSQIPPKRENTETTTLGGNDSLDSSSPDTNNEVGFFTADGVFSPGGEQLNTIDIENFKMSRSGWSTTSVLFIWTLILVLFVLGLARLLKGSFRDIWEPILEIRLIKRARRRFRHWRASRMSAASDMGYGYSFPHAGYPLTDFYGTEGTSSSRQPPRTPSRVESRVNLSDITRSV